MGNLQSKARGKRATTANSHYNQSGNGRKFRDLSGAGQRLGAIAGNSNDSSTAQQWLGRCSFKLALAKLDAQTATLLAAIYQLTDGINGLIRAREQFQVSMMALNGYQQVMTNFNIALRDKFQQYLRDNEKLRSALSCSFNN
jgi:hypothetical protein